MSDYNGFTNWETWNLRNWMKKRLPTSATRRRYRPGDGRQPSRAALDSVGDMPHGFERDALTATYEAVNWLELAETFTDE